jgi:predicted phosphodiesterase
MRLAIFADVHGNPIALEAVLADVARRGGVDGFWALGDLVAMGYDPSGVLRRLRTLPGLRAVRGNTDRYVLTEARPPVVPTVARAQADPALVPWLADVERSYAWTRGHVTGAGWLPWLDALPVETRLVLPDGTRLLGAHAAPGRDDGPGVTAALSDADLGGLVAGCGADLVCVGHTHRPLERRVGGVHVVNVGNVSHPLRDAPDPRACYALLEADPRGYRIALHRIDFDHEAVVAAIRRSRHPSLEFLTQVARRGRGANLPADPAVASSMPDRDRLA